MSQTRQHKLTCNNFVHMHTRGRISVLCQFVYYFLQLFACLRHVQGIVKHLEGIFYEKAACRLSANESNLFKARKSLSVKLLLFNAHWMWLINMHGVSAV